MITIEELIQEMKVRIAFIGNPKEPMNSAGPDWSKVVRMMDAFLAEQPKQDAGERIIRKGHTYYFGDMPLHTLTCDDREKAVQKTVEYAAHLEAKFKEVSLIKYVENLEDNEVWQAAMEKIATLEAELAKAKTGDKNEQENGSPCTEEEA